MTKSFRIGRKEIGENCRTFIIAEAGVNHAGSYNIARKMVEAAARSGADAVTFQHIIDSELNIAGYNKSKLQWDKWLLTDKQLRELFILAKKSNLLCTACVIDFESVDKVVDYGASFFKIVSGDLTNLPLIEYCAGKKLPIFMSTGAAKLGEIEAAINTIKSTGNTKVVIYHTNTNYPTPVSEINLNVIDTLNSAFGEIVGFCDHTEGFIAPLIAVSKGAKVIEKHFTLNRKLKGPDYQVALEPDELIEMVKSIKNVELMAGSPIKKLEKTEKNTYLYARRSIVAKENIAKGSKITSDMITYKRPGLGIPPSLDHLIIGKRAKQDIKPDDVIAFDMIC